MYYVYLLKGNVTKQLYAGYTNKLQRRVAEHQREDGAQELVYYEAYRREADARRHERQLKHHAQALTALKNRIVVSLR